METLPFPREETQRFQLDRCGAKAIGSKITFAGLEKAQRSTRDRSSIGSSASPQRRSGREAAKRVRRKQEKNHPLAVC
ncbi:hypothetical protein MUK42_33195 [Musa troglodytarum]|uniref:Uncharacterized protein n=1 Tax=Musa troglodytarum TaxID=320322 RepID=A0A9E7JSI7_9LILI|nr:hypothetical protein MUK42_33195 [Musa troglodytarum]